MLHVSLNAPEINEANIHSIALLVTGYFGSYGLDDTSAIHSKDGGVLGEEEAKVDSLSQCQDSA
jgi:hypothetical protein